MKQPKRLNFFEEDYAAVACLGSAVLLIEKLLIWGFKGYFHYYLMIFYAVVAVVTLCSGRYYKSRHDKYDKWLTKHEQEEKEKEVENLKKEEQRKKELRNFERYYNGNADK